MRRAWYRAIWDPLFIVAAASLVANLVSWLPFRQAFADRLALASGVVSGAALIVGGIARAAEWFAHWRARRRVPELRSDNPEAWNDRPMRRVRVCWRESWGEPWHELGVFQVDDVEDAIQNHVGRLCLVRDDVVRVEFRKTWVT